MILLFATVWVVLFFCVAYVTSMIAGLGVIEIAIVAIISGIAARLVARQLVPRFRRTTR